MTFYNEPMNQLSQSAGYFWVLEKALKVFTNLSSKRLKTKQKTTAITLIKGYLH